MTTTAGAGPEGEQQAADSTPFRFYDNRQKYLAFVNTCNEKAVIAARVAQELGTSSRSRPRCGSSTRAWATRPCSSRLMRSVHRYFPTVPLVTVAKEISLEDVRLGLEKMPDRFYEHPHTVLVITNLTYVDAPKLVPSDPEQAAGAQLAGRAPDGQVRHTTTTSRSRRWRPCSRTAGRRSRARRRVIRPTCGPRCS